MTVDMVIFNAKVLTMDEAQPRATAVALSAGRIVAVGGDEVAVLPSAQRIDAGGRSLLPGFVESHLHLVLGGAELTQLQLGGMAGFDDAEGCVFCAMRRPTRMRRY